MKSDWSNINGDELPTFQTPPVDHRIAEDSNTSSGSGKGKEPENVRRFPEEEDEEILKESNSRFVLFPIKYREVS